MKLMLGLKLWATLPPPPPLHAHALKWEVCALRVAVPSRDL